MKRLLVSPLVAILAAGLLSIAGCAQSAPPAPTAAPAKPAAAPTTAPAAPTAAPKAAEPTKPAPPTAAPAPKVSWPEKGRTVTMLVGVSAGSPSDLIARVIAPELEKVLGTPVQVLNKAGANEVIAATELVKSKPDGYTLWLSTLTTTAVNYLDPQAQVGYTRKDFAPVAIVESHSSAMISNSKGSYKTVKDLVDAAKAKPKSVVYVTTGTMTTGAFTIYALQELTGVKFAIVTSDAGSASLAAVLGGHADWSQVNTNLATEQVKAGALNAVATTGAERTKYLPDVPTFKEQGYNVVSAPYIGVTAPAATPKEVLGILESALKTVMSNADVIKKMETMYSGPMFMDSAAYAKLWDQAEIDAKLIIQSARSQ